VPFLTANAEVTTLPLLEAVIRDTAATIASIANPVVVIFFVCIWQAIKLFIKKKIA
jgi:hypothetical protein